MWSIAPNITEALSDVNMVISEDGMFDATVRYQLNATLGIDINKGKSNFTLHRLRADAVRAKGPPSLCSDPSVCSHSLAAPTWASSSL